MKWRSENIYRLCIELSCKVKSMIENVYLGLYESQWGHIPRKKWLSWYRNMRSAFRKQSSWRPRIKKLSDYFITSEYARYDFLPVRGMQYLTSGLGIENAKHPDHVWSFVGPHARTKLFSLEPFMVDARDECCGVEWWSGERGTGKCSLWESSDARVIAKRLLGHLRSIL